jgi:hypothetical protein
MRKGYLLQKGSAQYKLMPMLNHSVVVSVSHYVRGNNRKYLGSENTTVGYYGPSTRASSDVNQRGHEGVR